MDRMKIIIIVLVIWSIGATGIAFNANSSSNTVAGESVNLRAELSTKDAEISKLKERVAALEKSLIEAKTASADSKRGEDNYRKALRQAAQEKESGRNYIPTSQW